jgi:hypothetical protein
MLTREDDAGAGNAVAVLSYGYWTDRLVGKRRCSTNRCA